MTILEKITAYKRKEVLARKEAIPVTLLESFEHFSRETVSMSRSIANSETGIIAEHKRRSPSKKVINDTTELPDIVKGYEMAGASAISVLTDTKFFGGSLDDLLLARHTTSLPLLRKEFIVDPYQIFEAKAFGGDAILLIAACLDADELTEFASQAKTLGLEVLLEVHNMEELQKSMIPEVDMIGVNNRNLKTFEVSTEVSKSLSEHIPDDIVKISESGISAVDTIKELQKYGYQGFLIGENFMRSENPADAARTFIQKI